MVIEKFNIVTYIKPNHDFEMFATSLANIQQTKYLNKFCICFVKKLSNKFINELNKYENIIWKDNVNNYWAIEMKKMIDENNSKYYFIWEEDSHIYDITQFEKTYESLISNDIDFMLTQDKKWILMKISSNSKWNFFKIIINIVIRYVIRIQILEKHYRWKF